MAVLPRVIVKNLLYLLLGLKNELLKGVPSSTAGYGCGRNGVALLV